MKIQSIIATAALLGVLSSASALTTTAVSFEAPVPVKTIQPIELPPMHQGSEISLSMTIDAAGKPSNVRVANVRNQAAYKRIIATVSQWEFAPARKNGVAVPTKVRLPLEVKGL
ncbi:MAG TPA: energy transducer TonB [Lacunisphaera sp.]